jgi:glycosyltransferase involved in cell wall biosynthesis
VSLRHFGIYLAYGPRVDLQKEGLGRLLVAFLQAAATREDVRFVIACPQWSRKSLLTLLESEGISASSFDIVSTDGVPLILRIVLARSRGRIPRKPSRLTRLLAWIHLGVVRHRQQVERRLVATRSLLTWFAFTVYALILGILLSPLLAVAWLVRAAYRGFLRVARALAKFNWFHLAFNQLTTVVSLPGEEALMMRLYRLMEADEGERVATVVNSMPHVKAWYCPAAFWPAFNRVSAPRLMCVPDVVPNDFPVGFSLADPDLMKGVETVERAIGGGEHFVTYSSRVKWDTLVDRYSVSPAVVTVVPHACWDLSQLVEVSGFPDREKATQTYCESLLKQALIRLGGSAYTVGLVSDSIRFLFYPTQFRPNKNLLTLLRAYLHLLRERFIQQKLILTGNPGGLKPVQDFIAEHQLENDVLCLHGLTTRELAACYRLADLAVNPSLSEGGCPFTLTEALSVGTPVVMARIPVTEEVVLDETLREMMLFDPYDWQDAASKIEWALEHREALLSAQREFYQVLSKRTWRDVVDEHVAILDGLAAASVHAEVERP